MRRSVNNLTESMKKDGTMSLLLVVAYECRLQHVLQEHGFDAIRPLLTST